MASPEERRQEQTAKIAVLEEKSLTIQRQLDQITNNLNNHQIDEDKVLMSIHDSVLLMNEAINTKVESAVKPIREQVAKNKADIAKYKTIINVLITTLTVVGTIAMFFKDAIIHWLIG